MTQSQNSHLTPYMEEEKDTVEKIKKGFASVLENKPYTKIRMGEVAEASNISRQTIYRYFHSKEEILRSINDDLFDEFYERTEDMLGNFEGDYPQRVCEIVYEVVAERAQPAMALMATDASDIIYNQVRRYMKRVLGKVVRSQNIEIKDPEYLELVVDHISGAGYHVLKRWALGGMKYSPAQMARITAQILNVELLTLVNPSPDLK